MDSISSSTWPKSGKRWLSETGTRCTSSPTSCSNTCTTSWTCRTAVWSTLSCSLFRIRRFCLGLPSSSSRSTPRKRLKLPASVESMRLHWCTSYSYLWTRNRSTNWDAVPFGWTRRPNGLDCRPAKRIGWNCLIQSKRSFDSRRFLLMRSLHLKRSKACCPSAISPSCSPTRINHIPVSAKWEELHWTPRGANQQWAHRHWNSRSHWPKIKRCRFSSIQAGRTSRTADNLVGSPESSTYGSDWSSTFLALFTWSGASCIIFPQMILDSSIRLLVTRSAYTIRMNFWPSVYSP